MYRRETQLMPRDPCLNCGAKSVETLINFGLQPPSNRFLAKDAVDSEMHSLVVGQCLECGLIQLIQPMPVSMVKPRFEWVTYSEPENHLDDLIGRLLKLPGISTESKIIGLSYLDEPALARFSRSGFPHVLRCDAQRDSDIADRRAGLETIQSRMTEEIAAKLVRHHGKADILLARYIVEHSHNPRQFLQSLAQMVTPAGYLVLELPDCSKFVQACDYSFIWEEHICYFSGRTAADLASRSGFEIVDLITYSRPLEDSIVVVLRSTGIDQAPLSDAGKDRELAMGKRFAEAFGNVRARHQKYLARLRAEGKKIAIFGAGHLAAKFLNLLDLGQYVDCVIDDNPHKQGLAMPGSRLPIMGSAALKERGIDLCLLSVSPESESKVLSKHQDFAQRGGRFSSIFALSPLALHPE